MSTVKPAGNRHLCRRLITSFVFMASREEYGVQFLESVPQGTSRKHGGSIPPLATLRRFGMKGFKCRNCGEERDATANERKFGRVVCYNCGRTCDPTEKELRHLAAIQRAKGFVPINKKTIKN